MLPLTVFSRSAYYRSLRNIGKEPDDLADADDASEKVFPLGQNIRRRSFVASDTAEMTEWVGAMRLVHGARVPLRPSAPHKSSKDHLSLLRQPTPGSGTSSIPSASLTYFVDALFTIS